MYVYFGENMVIFVSLCDFFFKRDTFLSIRNKLILYKFAMSQISSLGNMGHLFVASYYCK